MKVYRTLKNRLKNDTTDDGKLVVETAKHVVFLLMANLSMTAILILLVVILLFK